MKTRILTLLIIAALCMSFKPAPKKFRIFVAGDSTAQTYREENTLMRGWAQYLDELFYENTEVINKAIGGRSSQSYIAEGRWDEIVKQLQAGDWVFIQFGHNDTSDNPSRHATPEQYKANLTRFCKDTRDKGANPVILTSIVMRTFDNGVLVDKRPHFAEYIQYARDVAAELNVPMIDLNKKSTELVSALGDDMSKDLYFWVTAGEHPAITEDKKDDTHLKETGARAYSRKVVEGIEELKLPLAKQLR